MTERPDPYRELIAHLEQGHRRMLAAADAAATEEVRIAQSGIAAGYLHAIGWALTLFEGHDARTAYLAAHADGHQHVHHDGPSVAECAADDRNWDAEKAGE